MRGVRTAVSVIIMVFAGIIGFFGGSVIDAAPEGAILFSVITGIACIIYTTDNGED